MSTISMIYINLARLSVSLFVSNTRQNGRTNRAQILCGASSNLGKTLPWWMIKILKFLKMHEKVLWNQQTFLFLFYTVQRADYSEIKPQFKVII